MLYPSARGQNVVKLFQLTRDGDRALSYEFDYEMTEQHIPNLQLMVNLTGAGVCVYVFVEMCVCV